jgi:hypothetical protein
MCRDLLGAEKYHTKFSCALDEVGRGIQYIEVNFKKSYKITGLNLHYEICP